MAFLEVITRTCGAWHGMLQRNLEGLTSQTDPDWTRRLVIDDQARGVVWANANLATVEASGEYVWLLDDDDVCCRATLVAELKAIAHMERPDVIMVRVLHSTYGVMPFATWQQRPQHGQVTTGNFVVRGDLWNAQRAAWDAVYEADYRWIDHMWLMPGLRWHWHDVTAAWIPQVSRGAAGW